MRGMAKILGDDAIFLRSRSTGEGVGAQPAEKEQKEFIEERSPIFLRPQDFSQIEGARVGQEALDALQFDQTTAETADGTHFVVPRSWEGLRLRCTLFWSADTAEIGDVAWAITLIGGSLGGQASDHTDSSGSIIQAKVGDAILQSIEWETSEYFSALDIIGVRVTRNADDAADTLDAKANFLGLMVEALE